MRRMRLLLLKALDSAQVKAGHERTLYIGGSSAMEYELYWEVGGAHLMDVTGKRKNETEAAGGKGGCALKEALFVKNGKKSIFSSSEKAFGPRRGPTG
jgi:hypothetical protein